MNLNCFLICLQRRLSPFRTFCSTILSTTMKPSLSFKIIGFVLCCSVCCEFGNSSAFLRSTALSVANGNQLAQNDTLLKLPIRRQTSQTQSKQTERFLNFKCKNCNGEFASSRSYDVHTTSQHTSKSAGNAL